MTKFTIEYNPYLVQCIFKKNNKVLSSNNKIGAKSGERLQILLGESVNWKGLLEEIAIAVTMMRLKFFSEGGGLILTTLNTRLGYIEEMWHFL